MAKYRILSFDGGGIRGIVAVILLQRLLREKALHDLVDRADLLAGTSCGGLLALALAKQVPLQDMRHLYEAKGREIFARSLFQRVADANKLLGADHDNQALAREAARLYGDDTLGQLKKHVLVAAFDLDNGTPARQPPLAPTKRRWKPKLFHNMPGRRDDRAVLARKVALYTTATPTFFPSVDGFIDGGVFASNPAMCAVAQTQDRRYQARRDKALPNPALSDVVVLSIGTGTALKFEAGERHDWGYLRWAPRFVPLVFDGAEGIVDYQCEQLLPGRYHRPRTELPPGMEAALDDIRALRRLVEFAEGVPLERTIAWLKRNW